MFRLPKTVPESHAGNCPKTAPLELVAFHEEANKRNNNKAQRLGSDGLNRESALGIAPHNEYVRSQKSRNLNNYVFS